MSTSTERAAAPAGGLTLVGWLLTAPARSFVSKRDDKTRTVIELRDPMRLGNYVVLFLDGDAGSLVSAPLNTRVTVRLDEVRSGRGRGELIGSAARAAVEQAFSAAANSGAADGAKS